MLFETNVTTDEMPCNILTIDQFSTPNKSVIKTRVKIQINKERKKKTFSTQYRIQIAVWQYTCSDARRLFIDLKNNGIVLVVA